MRGLLMGCVAAGFALLAACGSDCNNDCQQCRDLVSSTESTCEIGCAGDGTCLEICRSGSCQQDDLCDGTLDDDCS